MDLTAIVTGGGRGIGLATARALTARGVRVTVFARTETEIAQAVREGAAARSFSGDVSREDDVRKLLEVHERELGPVDVLVNNAGVLVRGKVEETSARDFRFVLDVNLVGSFLCARAVVPSMKARKSGRIVNVTSISATLGTALSSAYNASKWGLLGMTKCLAEELREFGIACLSVSPGSTDTEMLRRTPFLPQMTADDVAKVITYAALDAPSVMTGANLEVFG